MSQFSDPSVSLGASLPKVYDASSVEDAIAASWESSGAFNPDTLPDRNKRGEPYCIVMPPPNVTGVLHLGHALENALMDTMARFQRMNGKRVLLVPGTDHAAIATQAKVEKMLMKQGVANPRAELGREALVEKIRAFAEQSKQTIVSQIRVMGTSCDWSRLAYTFDDARNTAVKELFVRLYQDSLIYRGHRVVNWSVKGQSTCSDDEIEYVERASKLYTFKYAKDFPITIATTRPETKLGDTAVAVHPSDERYRAYIGKTYTVDVGAHKPREITIIADDSVDPQFGTGALGVTPAHSAVDFAMFEKQKALGTPIGLIPVVGNDGKMTTEAGAGYVGLTVEEAREKFIAWLRSEGLLEKEEETVQRVGTSDRYGDVIEAIPMTQWWLNVTKVIPGRQKSLRDLMRDAVTTGLDGNAEKKVMITPDRFTKLYLDRVEKLHDWCLSRQLWWGHRIPVWYRGEETHVGTSAPQGDGWEQDPDTLDTWFSSGSWTFSTLGWPEKTSDLATFHPTQWITMGYEILYLWLMRMILMSTYVLNDVPFKDAYMHGMLRDKDGEKFSKSLDNGIDPIKVVEQYGCDALRISLLIGNTPGQDSRYSTEKMESGRNFVNKLWNISRFMLLQGAGYGAQGAVGKNADGGVGTRLCLVPSGRTLADQWILSRLDEVTASVTRKIESFEFSSAGEELRDFTWSDLADWYLEIAKVEGDKKDILSYILQTVLKLWHPFMPFVTEHIWKTAGFGGLLIVAEWPTSTTHHSPLTTRFDSLRSLITDIRRLRAEQGIEPAKQIEIGLATTPDIRELVQANEPIVQHLARATSITYESIPAGWVTTISGVTTIGLNAAGAVDADAERAKAQKELTDTQRYVSALNQQLANQEFTSKAPASVVEGMKAKREIAEVALKALEMKIKKG